MNISSVTMGCCNLNTSSNLNLLLCISFFQILDLCVFNLLSGFRDDMSIQYSPMSDDSDDSRYCDTTPINTCSSQPESLQTSPVSPYRFQRPLSGFSYAPPTTTSNPSHSSSIPNATSSQPRQRNTDSEGRFPSSPSDICHSADLRRAALLRSVQMRTQPVGPSPFELPFSSGQESVHNIEETEERPCSFMKSLVDHRDYPIEECSSFSIPEPEYSMEKSCTVVNMKVDEPTHYVETEVRPCSFMKSLGDERNYQIQVRTSFIMSEPEYKGETSSVMKMKGDEPADKIL